MHSLDFFETLKIIDNKIINFKFHKKRILDTLVYLKTSKKINLYSYIKILDELNFNLKNYLNSKILNKHRLRIDFRIINNKINFKFKSRKLIINKKLNIAISSKPTINSKNQDHNFKFNYLNIYYKEFNKDLLNTYDDIILINEKYEICETSKTNIYILKDNKFVTPPLNSGVLAGTYRAKLLSLKKIKFNNKYYNIKEHNINLDDLKDAKLFISNALFGLLEIKNPLVT